eukprot:TRINITY_DN9472_c0_g1_i1.p1 TRINITY_DN9472_c0_g1~~TRINITY_DN9472_c0_g1_i1.p1  ORF type:complete len:220 (-),score=30.81 TRINITY_DN9472_c0_g1_i1:102-761(-)
MDLEESELGSKEFWCQQYEKELQNFQDYGDQGEIWFGEDVEDRMCDFILEISQNEDVSKIQVLDVGTGNGSLLFKLKQMGFKELKGSDYSEESIKLCKSIAQQTGVLEDTNFLVDDLLDTKIQERFDMITDKGTFDAISLMEDSSQTKLQYLESVAKLLKVGGKLVITSCNYTIEEVKTYFENKKLMYFTYMDHVRDYPQIEFGGHSGSKVCTLAFRKN